MADLQSPYGPYLGTDQNKSNKGGSKGSVSYTPPDQSNNPYGGFSSLAAYNEWQQSQYGVPSLGQPILGGKNRLPETELNIPPLTGAFYDPYNPIGSLAVQGYINYENEAAEQYNVEDRPPIWFDPFGDPYGGAEESRPTRGAIGAARWTPELQQAITEAYWGMRNFDPSYNVGVQETGEPNYGGSGYGNNYYYPQYRYGNYEQAKSWYNNMLNWKIS